MSYAANVFTISGAFYTDAVSAQRSGGASGPSAGVFVPSDTDLWHRLDALFLNEQSTAGVRGDCLPRTEKYYMGRTFNLITGQRVSRQPYHFSPVCWNNRYQIFYLWASIPEVFPLK